MLDNVLLNWKGNASNALRLMQILTNEPEEQLNILVVLTSSFCALIAFFSGPWIMAQRVTLISLYFFFCFLGPHWWHMEVPRLGVKSELQLLPAYNTATATSDSVLIYDLHHSSGQLWILNPLMEARDRTCVLMVPSWICFHCATQELHFSLLFPCTFIFFFLQHSSTKNYGNIGKRKQNPISEYPFTYST